MRRPRGSAVWRDRSFRAFWAGQVVSAAGTQVSLLALPLTAVLTLGASPAQMGLLAAAQNAPALLIGLLAGAWIDRWPKRPILIASALGRAVVLASVPLCHALGVLTLAQLYVVGLLMGTLGTCAGIATGPFLLALVQRARIQEANSTLEMSGSTVEVVGPGVAGPLVQVLTAPVAIGLDALSFVVSALTLRRVRPPEVAREAGETAGVWREIAEGLSVTLRHALVGRIVLAATLLEFFDSAFFSLYTLYVIDHLDVAPAALGLIFTVGGIGGILGAAAAGWASRRFGVGWAITGGLLVMAIGELLIPIASFAPRWAVPILAAAELLVGISGMIFGINQTSLRLALIPDRLQGRANATARTLIGGASTFGPLAGGIVAATFGLRPLFVGAAICTALGGLWLLFSAVPRLRELPSAEVEPSEAAIIPL